MPDIRDEMSISHRTKRKQEVENVLLLGLPIINLKLLAAEGHIKTFAFSRTYQVRLQKAIQCRLKGIWHPSARVRQFDFLSDGTVFKVNICDKNPSPSTLRGVWK